MRIDVAFSINQVCEIENNISSATVKYTLARRTELLESLHRPRLSIFHACEIAKSSLGLIFRLLCITFAGSSWSREYIMLHDRLRQSLAYSQMLRQVWYAPLS